MITRFYQSEDQRATKAYFCKEDKTWQNRIIQRHRGNVSSQNINELIRVRREKLAALQEAGKDPFAITKYNQTHHTDEVKSLYNDHEAKLLAGRVRPSTEGLDEQQAKDVINED